MSTRASGRLSFAFPTRTCVRLVHLRAPLNFCSFFRASSHWACSSARRLWRSLSWAACTLSFRRTKRTCSVSWFGGSLGVLFISVGGGGVQYARLTHSTVGVDRCSFSKTITTSGSILRAKNDVHKRAPFYSVEVQALYIGTRGTGEKCVGLVCLSFLSDDTCHGRGEHALGSELSGENPRLEDLPSLCDSKYAPPLHTRRRRMYRP